MSNITDKSTISENWDDDSVKWHYDFIESHIIPYVSNPENILDIGTGAGHWVDFYLNHTQAYIYSEEISGERYSFLAQKYKGNNKVLLTHRDSSKGNEKKVEIINAIGVLHHMKDRQLKRALDRFSKALGINGLLFIGSKFESTQYKAWKMYKKYRSLAWWTKQLNKRGFDIECIHFTCPPDYIKPHLDLMVSRKRTSQGQR